VVSGTSNAVAFETVNLRNVPAVTIDLATNDGGVGVDTVTISSGTGTHGVGSLAINTDGGADTLNFNGNLSIDGNFVLSGVETVVLGANITLDTEQGNNSAGGNVDVGGAQINGNAQGRDLTINTATTGAGFAGGGVTLANIGTASTTTALNDVVITTTGPAGNGALSLGGNIFLETNAGDRGILQLVGGGDVRVLNSLTIDTEQGDDELGGDVDWTTSNLFAVGAGRTLTISAQGSAGSGTAGGTVFFGLVDDDAGGANFLTALTIATDGAGGGGSGRINLAANVFVDGNIVLGRRPNPLTSIVIDSEQGNNGNAGAITLNGALSSSVAATDLTLDASVVGFLGGNVTLGDSTVDNSHGFYLNDFTINTAGTTPGSITIRNNITLDAANDADADPASFVIQGGGLIQVNNAAGATIDTEVGDNNPGGPVNFGTSALSSLVAGNVNFAINTNTGGTDGGGAVTLGPVNGSAGQFINDLTINTAGSPAGVTTLTANVSVSNNGGADPGSLTIAGDGAIRIATTLTILMVPSSLAAALALTLIQEPSPRLRRESISLSTPATLGPVQTAA
jgi:hypothetical protein